MSRVRSGSRPLLATVVGRGGYFDRDGETHCLALPLDDAHHGLMTPNEQPPESSTFRSTLIRVMAMQVGALIVLWLLQARYGS